MLHQLLPPFDLPRIFWSPPNVHIHYIYVTSTVQTKKEDEHAWQERLKDIVLNRNDDDVHKATLEVVSSVTQMIKTLDNNTSSCSQLVHLYLPLVKVSAAVLSICLPICLSLIIFMSLWTLGTS